jgi:hypothetical protein
MRPSHLLAAALLLLTTSACGDSTANPGASIDEGYSSLNSGSYAQAVSSFQSALAGLAEGDKKYLEAKLGELRAQCYIDASKARAGLLALSKTAGVEAGHYSMVVTDLVSAATKQAADNAKAAASATIGEAVAILEAGQQKFPDYDKWKGLLNKVGDKATTLGSADSLEALRGLGYVGGD